MLPTNGGTQIGFGIRRQGRAGRLMAAKGLAVRWHPNFLNINVKTR
jgi:hypothetical protein